MNNSNCLDFKEISMLNEREKLQIQYQLQQHTETELYEIEIQIGPKNALRNFLMYPGVLKPMSSIALAHFLNLHPNLYNGKVVIDMGSGSGIQGIVALLNGAEKVIFSDISTSAYRNTLANVERFCPDKQAIVVKGDLFENVNESADLVVFAEPYFPGNPIKDYPVTLGMLNSGELVQRFLLDAKKYTKGSILMPFIDWISETNNPKVQGVKHDYKVREVYHENLQDGIQQGKFSIYELTL